MGKLAKPAGPAGRWQMDLTQLLSLAFAETHFDPTPEKKITIAHTDKRNRRTTRYHTPINATEEPWKEIPAPTINKRQGCGH
jgi:hypothetical protein